MYHLYEQSYSNHKTHFGFWAEYVTLAALELVARKTVEKVYHEHVTNYIYTHPNDFK